MADSKKIINDLKIHGIYTAKDARKNPNGVLSHGVLQATKTSLRIGWQNPLDADFTGVQIVLKENTAPTSANDGVVVLTPNVGDVTDIVPSSVDGYEDLIRSVVAENLNANTTYYFAFYPCDSVGVVEDSPNVIVSSGTTWGEGLLYGFTINENDSSPEYSIKYIEDSSDFNACTVDNDTSTVNLNGWENRFPFNQIRIVTLDSNGSVTGEVDQTNFTQYTDGTAVSGDVMVEIPTVWWCTIKNGDVINCYISNEKLSDDFHAPAHTKDNVVKDYLYIGVYLSTLESEILYSKSTGAVPSSSISCAKAEQYTANKGDGWNNMDYTSFSLLQILMVLVTKNLNTQTSFGYGVTSSSTSYSANWITGFQDTNGLYCGSTSNYYAIPVKFMGIENIWGNFSQPLSGVSILPTGITLTPNNGTTTYQIPYTAISSSYMTKAYGSTFAPFLPLSSAGGSSTTYYCDRCNVSSSGSKNVLYVECRKGSGTYVGGIFNLCSLDYTSYSSNISARIEFL